MVTSKAQIPELETIVAGDIELIGPHRDRLDFTMDISNEHGYFSHISLNQGKVMAHLLKNPDKLISQDEIAGIFGWTTNAAMRSMRALEDAVSYSNVYELVRVLYDNTYYMLRTRKQQDNGKETKAGKPVYSVYLPNPGSQKRKSPSSKAIRRPLNINRPAEENTASAYARLAVNVDYLKSSQVQVLSDIEEVAEISGINPEQLEIMVKREEAKRFLRTQGGQTRFYLGPFILFLNGQGELYKPAAERLYAEYVKRTK